MAAVVSRIRGADLDSLSILVHHLFGNTSVRFRQADDTLSLAVKLPGEGGWHLLGDVVFTPDIILREQVKLVSRNSWHKQGKNFYSANSALCFRFLLHKHYTWKQHNA